MPLQKRLTYTVLVQWFQTEEDFSQRGIAKFLRGTLRIIRFSKFTASNEILIFLFRDFFIM